MRESLDESHDITVRFSVQDEDEEILQEFELLQEKRLMKKIMGVAVSILTAIGLVSFFIPYIYLIVPVYETD